jgi:enoyl-CoA hydratase
MAFTHALTSMVLCHGLIVYLMFSGEIVTAGEACQIGLVEKVCPPEKLMEEVDGLARKISSNGPLAIKAMKRAVNGGIERPLEDALKLELTEYGKLAFSKDAEDGMVAFSEKRTPTFKGE